MNQKITAAILLSCCVVLAAHFVKGQEPGNDLQIQKGMQTFRFDTFGDEAWWGDTLRLHEAIEGAKFGGIGPGISPATALSLGLKVDLDALPPSLVQRPLSDWPVSICTHGRDGDPCRTGTLWLRIWKCAARETSMIRVWTTLRSFQSPRPTISATCTTVRIESLPNYLRCISTNSQFLLRRRPPAVSTTLLQIVAGNSSVARQSAAPVTLTLFSRNLVGTCIKLQRSVSMIFKLIVRLITHTGLHL